MNQDQLSRRVITIDFAKVVKFIKIKKYIYIMKSILLLFTLIYLSGFSQLQWDYLGGFPVEMDSQIDACIYLDFEQNGSNEVKIVHGINGGCYFTTDTDIPIYAPTHNINSKTEFWSDCDISDTSCWVSDTAYIRKNGEQLSVGSHVLPFKYGDKFGYFVLKLDAGSDTLKIRGYVFQIDPKDFECYQLPSTAGIKELNLNSGKFKDYNMIGQEVNEYHSGLTIRVFESGHSTKVYK